MDYTTKVKRIVSEKSGVEPEDITLEAYFEDDLNLGKMELIEILEELEELYEAELISRKGEIETFSDLIDILEDTVD